MSTRLTLDRAHLMQMLTRDDFYTACPTFAYLRACAMEANTIFLADKAAGKKVCCGLEWGYYRGVVDAFFMRVRQAVTEQDADTLAALKEYLTIKKGYLVKTLVIYYRRSQTQKKIAKLSF